MKLEKTRYCVPPMDSTSTAEAPMVVRDWKRVNLPSLHSNTTESVLGLPSLSSLLAMTTYCTPFGATRDTTSLAPSVAILWTWDCINESIREHAANYSLSSKFYTSSSRLLPENSYTVEFVS